MPKFRNGKYVPTKKEKAAGVEICAIDGHHHQDDGLPWHWCLLRELS